MNLPLFYLGVDMKRFSSIFILVMVLLAAPTAYAESGRYQLYIADTKSGEHETYRLNTETGEVWQYTKEVILNSESVGLTGKAKEGLDNLIQQSKNQGKNVYTTAHWVKLDEYMVPNIYTTE